MDLGKFSPLKWSSSWKSSPVAPAMTREQSPEANDEIMSVQSHVQLSAPGSPERRQLATQRRRTTGAMGEDEMSMVEHMLREKARKDLVMDICSVMTNMREKEPQQIIINNMSTAQTRVEDRKEGKSRGSVEVLAETLKSFFASPFNRVCFFTASGATLYLAWGYLHHKWEMEAIQKKIDANFLMRASQWLFDEQKTSKAVKTWI